MEALRVFFCCGGLARFFRLKHALHGLGLVSGSGFRVEGSGLRAQGLGFRVEGSGFRGLGV